MTMDFQPTVPLEQGLDGTLGIEIDSRDEDGTVHGHMAVEDRVRQPYGLVHGGVYAAIAESLASAGTFVSVVDDGKIAVGMSNLTHFLRSITEGTVHAKATPLHRGRTTWVWDVTLSDDEGRTAAISRVTIAVRDRPHGT